MNPEDEATVTRARKILKHPRRKLVWGLVLAAYAIFGPIQALSKSPDVAQLSAIIAVELAFITGSIVLLVSAAKDKKFLQSISPKLLDFAKSSKATPTEKRQNELKAAADQVNAVKLAEQQKQAELKSDTIYNLKPEDLFSLVMQVCSSLSWQVVQADRGAGFINVRCQYSGKTWDGTLGVTISPYASESRTGSIIRLSSPSIFLNSMSAQDKGWQYKANDKLIARVREASYEFEQNLAQIDAAQSSSTKICPDCAESVQKAAKKCRYCGLVFV